MVKITCVDSSSRAHKAGIAEGVNSETPYLAPNDLIITSGNDLYDGKHFD